MTGSILADEPAERPVLSSVDAFVGGVWTVRKDRVDLGAGGVHDRDYVVHPGAVAVLALDADDRVLLVRQYRHPVRAMCWELPAGLRDVEDEPLVATAARELAEETAYRAARWFQLMDVQTTPGGSSEQLVIFLARDVSEVPADDPHVPQAEEVGMEVAWFPFDEVLEAVLTGRVKNPSLVVGVLAANVHRTRDWAGLRAVTPL